MREQEFRTYMRRAGRGPRVVDETVRRVQDFAAFLAARGGHDLATAAAEDLAAFVASLESGKPGAANGHLRAIASYCTFAGNEPLAGLAQQLRQARIAPAAFKLRGFVGVRAEHLAALQACGIRDVRQMLAAAATAEQRRGLAQRAGLPLAAVEELARLSDLARLPGVKGIRARLYYDAGIDSVARLAACEPEALLALTADFVARTGFPGIAPLPKEVSSTIENARHLPRLLDC